LRPKAAGFPWITSFGRLTRLPGAPVRPSPTTAEPRSAAGVRAGAAGVRAGAAAERSEGSLDAGEHRGPLDGRWVTIHFAGSWTGTKKVLSARRNSPSVGLNFEEKQKLLRKIIHRIVITAGRVTIKLAIPLSTNLDLTPLGVHVAEDASTLLHGSTRASW